MCRGTFISYHVINRQLNGILSKILSHNRLGRGGRRHFLLGDISFAEIPFVVCFGSMLDDGRIKERLRDSLG